MKQTCMIMFLCTIEYVRLRLQTHSFSFVSFAAFLSRFSLLSLWTHTEDTAYNNSTDTYSPIPSGSYRCIWFYLIPVLSCRSRSAHCPKHPYRSLVPILTCRSYWTLLSLGHKYTRLIPVILYKNISIVKTNNPTKDRLL